MIGETMMRSLTAVTRTSMAEMMSNVWENVQYTMAQGMANNPVSYLLFKTATLLEEATGGIDIPFLNVYGFGVDLNMSIAQMMQIGAMAGGIMTGLGSMISGLGQVGTNFLAALGAGSGAKAIERGTGEVASATSGAGTSASGLIGNGSSADMQAATMAQAADDIASIGQQGKEENEDATRDDIIEILKLLFGDIGKKIEINTAAINLQGAKSRGENVSGLGFTDVNAYTTKSDAL
jgi:hypothetical protein